jgi:hypothetical protein
LERDFTAVAVGRTFEGPSRRLCFSWQLLENEIADGPGVFDGDDDFSDGGEQHAERAGIAEGGGVGIENIGLCF